MKPQFTITEAMIEREIPTNDPLWVVVRHDWLEDVKSQFIAIANLPDGWDGDGASRPDVRSVEAAWGLLTSLCRGEGVDRPHVNPTRSGGIQLEWENGSRYFELEVVAEHAATYLYRDPDSSVEETGEVFEGEPLCGIIEYIMRVGANVRRRIPRPSKSALGYECIGAVA